MTTPSDRPLTPHDVLARPELRAMRQRLHDLLQDISPGVYWDPNPAVQRQHAALEREYRIAVDAAMAAAGLPPYYGPPMERRYADLRAAYVRAVNHAMWAAGLPPYEALGCAYPGYGPQIDEERWQ